jgi:tetratricopeptide (TPR) repeat protein
LIAEALQTARSIELEGWTLGSGLGVVAEGLAEVGRINDALSAAEAVEWPPSRPRVLAGIANSLVAAGRYAEALQIAQSIAQPKDRADALVSIAAAQAKAGLIAQASTTSHHALQVAQSLVHKPQIVSVLLATAEVLPN